LAWRCPSSDIGPAADALGRDALDMAVAEENERRHRTAVQVPDLLPSTAMPSFSGYKQKWPRMRGDSGKGSRYAQTASSIRYPPLSMDQ
jgi:hypothetical protein